MAERRKSPGPGEYAIQMQAINVKPKLKGKSPEQFDSKAARFRNSPFDAPGSTTQGSVGPGSYLTQDEVMLQNRKNFQEKLKQDEIKAFNRLR